jgi:flagellar motor switch protein FliN
MSPTVSSQILLDVDLRVSAELGRTRMPVSAAVGLSSGAIIELDRSHDEPIDLYVNGRHFGTGRLLIVDGEWSVRIESVDGVQTPAEPAVAHLSVAVPPVADGGESAPGAADPGVGEITPVDLSSEGQA